MTPPINQDGPVKSAARVFWRTRQFWLLASLIIITCILVGYLIGNWHATNNANKVLAQQEAAYREAGDARKAVMQQCLANNEKLTARLATLGSKATDTAKAATDALQKLSTDLPVLDKEPNSDQ